MPPPFSREGASSAPPVAPIGREYWSPPPPAAAPKSTRSTSLGKRLLISVVSFALAFLAVSHFLNHNALPSGTSEFVAGHGISYSSPDRTFDARFPVPPTVEHKPIATPSGTVTMNLAQVQTDDYELVAASIVLPVAVSADRADAVLRDVLREGTSAQGATITSEASVTRYGATGIEARAKVKDGYAARLMVLVSGNHVYFLGAHAKHGNDRLYDALVGSLILY